MDQYRQEPNPHHTLPPRDVSRAETANPYLSMPQLSRQVPSTPPPLQQRTPVATVSRELPRLPRAASTPTENPENPFLSHKPINQASQEAGILQLTNAFTDALKQFTQHVQTTGNKNPHHLFFGEDHEDPRWFLQQMDKFFMKNRIQDDQDRIAYAIGQLRGEAKKWYEPYKYLLESYDLFRERLLQRFDSPTNITLAMTRLYGDRQKEGEPVAVFITKKRCLFTRLDPRLSEQMMTAIILEQLLPEIRSRLRGYLPVDTEDLVGVATQVENDLKALTPSTTSASWRDRDVRSRRYDNYPKQDKKSTQTSITNEDKSLSRNVIRDTNAEGSTQRMEKSNDPKKPPTPCKYCQQWHYHSQCPKNPYHQGRTQGNSPGVDSERRRGQPTPRVHQIEIPASTNHEEDLHPPGTSNQ